MMETLMARGWLPSSVPADFPAALTTFFVITLATVFFLALNRRKIKKD